MNKKRVWQSPNPNGWWRKHTPEEKDTIIRYLQDNDGMIKFPTKEEAQDSWNTLIWWCVSQWMQPWDYTHERICDELKTYISKL